MRYIEYKGKIHQVFGDANEWKKEGYAQKAPLDYLYMIENYADNNTVKLWAKGFVVGKWIAIYTGKYQGVMRLLSITKKRFGHDSATWFETCYGWARFGDRDFTFDPGKFLPEKKKVSATPREYNFAASFALNGDLKLAYIDNIGSYDQAGPGSHPISKKKPLPCLLGSYKILRSVTSLESSMCHAN